MNIAPRQISSVEETGIEAWDYSGVERRVVAEHMQEICDRHGMFGIYTGKGKGMIVAGQKFLDAYVMIKPPAVADVPRLMPRMPRKKDWLQRTRRCRPS